MNDLPLWAFFERQLLATEVVDQKKPPDLLTTPPFE